MFSFILLYQFLYVGFRIVLILRIVEIERSNNKIPCIVSELSPLDKSCIPTNANINDKISSKDIPHKSPYFLLFLNVITPNIGITKIHDR